jgi:hypothetical protein
VSAQDANRVSSANRSCRRKLWILLATSERKTKFQLRQDTALGMTIAPWLRLSLRGSTRKLPRRAVSADPG